MSMSGEIKLENIGNDASPSNYQYSTFEKTEKTIHVLKRNFEAWFLRQLLWKFLGGCLNGCLNGCVLRLSGP